MIRLRSTAALLLALAASCATAAQPLPRLGVDVSKATLSGLSSGGFMAVQMHVAYSATFASGAGIVAGGPFYCAEGSAFNATHRCSEQYTPIPVASLATTAQAWARSGAIDAPSNLARSRVYLYSGSGDKKVLPAVMNDLLDFYQRFVPAANIAYRNDLPSGHAMITDDYGSKCSASELPFIDDCDFDLAGALLKHLYGPLKPRNDGALGGTFTEFDQRPYVSGHGMATSGWLYVPQACAAGAGTSCKLHVVFHGCKQNPAYISQQFVRNTGYNRWADTNAIVVLYPQTGGFAVNGCWDWWGYDSADYAKKSGPQMLAVKAMVDTLAATGNAPPFTAKCYTASNYAHTVAGRAHVAFGVALADGSEQNMGWWNVFTTTTLKQTGPGYYVVGSCP